MDAQQHVKTLRNGTHGFGRREIVSGYKAGLRKEMSDFFQTAKIHSSSVMNRQMEHFKASQARGCSKTLSFDRQTENWTQTPPKR